MLDVHVFVKQHKLFDGRRFCIPKFRYSTLQQTTRRRWFPTSCFCVTNHSKAAFLWLVRQDWANNNSGSLPSCDAPFWEWSVASPSEMFDWQVRYLDIYLFYVVGRNYYTPITRIDVCTSRTWRTYDITWHLRPLATITYLRNSCYLHV